MPLAETFFSPRFGMVVDRFGVSWMVYVAPAAPAPERWRRSSSHRRCGVFCGVPEAQVAAATVGEALAGVFGATALRGYVLDDQGALRRHVAIYVNGAPVRDRTGLSDPVGRDDEIYVFQALTGG